MKLSRISNLFRAYLIENKKMLLICSLIVFAAAVLDLTLSYHAEFSAIAAYFIPFWIAGRFFQTSLKRNNSTHFFNLPVTTGEKLMVATVVIILFSILIALLFNAGAYTGYYGLRPLLNPLERSLYFETNRPVITLWETQLYLYFGVVLVVFLFGSIYFKKNAFWKTFACGTGFFIGLVLYMMTLLHATFRNISEIAPGLTIKLRDYEFIGESYIIPIALIVFFLSLTYLRLKETEV